jgi:PDZ domain/Aspartyl protease
MLTITTRLKSILSTIVPSGSGVGAITLILALSMAQVGQSAQVPATAPERAPTQVPVSPKAAKAVVPFEMLPTNHMLVRARINDKGPYLLVFDLGAPITLLGNTVSEAAGVVKASAPRSFLFAMRGEATADKLQVGNLTVAKLPVLVFDHPVLKTLGRMTGRPIDGIMGFTFFARYKTTIDYQAHQMTFERVDYAMHDLLKELPERLLGPKVVHRRILVPSAMLGLRLGNPTNGVNSPGVPIADVYKDSPAERTGLKSGDVLISLGGRWTASITDVFDAANDIEPGRDAAVVILRDGVEKTLTIHPVDGA